MTDEKLIKQYVADGSEDAFRQIVARYLKMVYATCQREVQNPEMAQDVAQIVFVLLAQKARRLRSGTLLSGWLFTTARFASKEALRRERRRHYYETQAVAQMPTYEDREAYTGTAMIIEPWLNAALAALKTGDREALLLRYAEERSLREIGEMYGISETGAKMRLTRALEKLREGLRKRGVDAPEVSALTIALPGLLAGSLLTLPSSVSAAAISHAVPDILAGSVGAPGLIAPGIHQLLQAVQRTILITKVTTWAIIVAAIGVMSVYPIMVKARQTKHDEAVAALAAIASARYDAIDQAFEHHDAAAMFKLLPRVEIFSRKNHFTGITAALMGVKGNSYAAPWDYNKSGLESSMLRGDPSALSKMKHDIKAVTVGDNIAAITVEWSTPMGFAGPLGPAQLTEKFLCRDTWIDGSSGWELQRREVNAETVLESDGKPSAYVMDRLIALSQVKQFTRYMMDRYWMGGELSHTGRFSTMNDRMDYKPFTPNLAISNLTLQQIPDPTKTILLYEAAPDVHGNRVVSFVDGHQSILTEDQWKALGNFTTILIKNKPHVHHVGIGR